MSEELSCCVDTAAEGRELMRRIVAQNEEIVKMNVKMVELLSAPPCVVLPPVVLGASPSDTNDAGGRDFTWSGRRGD